MALIVGFVSRAGRHTRQSHGSQWLHVWPTPGNRISIENCFQVEMAPLAAGCPHGFLQNGSSDSLCQPSANNPAWSLLKFQVLHERI